MNYFLVDDAPTALAVDSANGQIFVAGNFSVRVFNQTDSGKPAPVRSFSVDAIKAPSDTITALAYDPVNHRLYVGVQATPNAILIYSDTAVDNGAVHPVPLQTINGSNSSFSVDGLLYDPVSSEIVRSSRAGLYTYPNTASGVPTPTRTITIQGSPGAIAFDTAGRYWMADYFSGNQYSTALLAYIPSNSSTGAATILGAIGPRLAFNNNVPAWLVADPVKDELWMNSLSNGNFVGVFARTAAVINDEVPLRQWGGNSAGADYSAIALNPVDHEVYVVSTLTVSTFSSTAATDVTGVSFGTPIALPAADIPNNAVYDSANHELVVSLNDNAIAFYPRTGAGSFATRRLTIAGPSTLLNQPNALAVDGTLVYAVNRDGSIVQFDRSSGSSDRTPTARLTQQVSALNPARVGAILLDGGNLYVANSRTATRFQISVYPLANLIGSVTLQPARTIEVRGAGSSAQGLAFCN